MSPFVRQSGAETDCFVKRSSSRGFTLIELLVVLGIIGLLLALIVPAFKGIGGANKLTSASNMVVAEIDLARQTALAQNQEVELRFYSLPNEAGENKKFRGLQRYVGGSSVGKLMRLPEGIILSDASNFSTLLSSFNEPLQNSDLPIYGNSNYRSLRFQTTGATYLAQEGADSGNDRWFLTLKKETDPERTSPPKPADNFITIMIDPITGRTQVFQP